MRMLASVCLSIEQLDYDLARAEHDLERFLLATSAKKLELESKITHIRQRKTSIESSMTLRVVADERILPDIA